MLNDVQNKIIEDLKGMLKNIFTMEFTKFAPINNSRVNPEDVFNRWFNTTSYTHPNNLISAMCLRASQAGYPCYPVKDNPEYTGIESTLKDEEITKVIYGSSINSTIEDALKQLCSIPTNAKMEFATQN